jgi:hypothetical protein
VVTGIKGAIDFLRKNLHVESLDNLPYDNLLVPLTVFFSGEPTKQKKISNSQRKEILRWFWHTCIHRKYNSQPIKSLREDVIEFAQLAEGTVNKLTHPEAALSPSFFISNTFRLNSVVSRTFILMLAQNGPRSFLSGNKIDLRKALKEYNRNEFHHIYPKSFLRASSKSAIDDPCLANICFLSRSDNNIISGDPPSQYRKKMGEEIEDIEQTNFLSSSTWLDNFARFIDDRSALLTQYAKQLLDGGTTPRKAKQQ